MRLNEQNHTQRQPAHCGSSAEPDGGVTAIHSKPGNLIRLPIVEAKTGLKKSTIYAAAKAKTFPAAVRLSARAVAWREDEIDDWISARLTTGGQQ